MYNFVITCPVFVVENTFINNLYLLSYYLRYEIMYTFVFCLFCFCEFIVSVLYICIHLVHTSSMASIKALNETYKIS